MKRKILVVSMALSLFFGGMAVADSVNGLFEGNPIVRLFSGSNELVASDVPAIIYHNRTLVPISLLKQMGLKVTWDAQQYAVHIELPKPDLTDAQLNEIAKSVAEVFPVDDNLHYNSTGSGFLLSNQLFLTNDHVGSDNKEIQFQLNGKTFNNHGITLFHNKVEDIYAIKIDEPNGLKYTGKLPDVGDKIYTISYPKGKFSITKGFVTGIVNITGRTMIEFDAPIDNGSSGGALINNDGSAIGIITSGFTGTNRNQALPLSYMEDELKKLALANEN